MGFALGQDCTGLIPSEGRAGDCGVRPSRHDYRAVLVRDKLGPQPLIAEFSPERETSVYGHGQAVIRYLRHLQGFLDQDREPVPGCWGSTVEPVVPGEGAQPG